MPCARDAKNDSQRFGIRLRTHFSTVICSSSGNRNTNPQLSLCAPIRAQRLRRNPFDMSNEMVFRILHDLCVPKAQLQTDIAKHSHVISSRDRKHTYVAKTQQIIDPSEDGTLSASTSPLAHPLIRDSENFHPTLELACGNKRRNVTLSR